MRADGRSSQHSHAAYYCALAETAEAGLWTTQVGHWLEWIQTELDNFRAALAWMQTAPDSTEAWLRLASALHQFWDARGPKSEGRRWLDAGLMRADAGVSGLVRRRALFWAGWLARISGDYPAAERCFAASLRISQQIGDRSGEGWASIGLSNVAWNRRADDRAVAAASESLAILQELGEKLGIAQSRDSLGRAARAVGDYEVARANYAECLELCQELGYLNGIGSVLMELGHLARAQGQDDQAATFYDQSLQLAKELDSRSVIAEILWCQAQLAHKDGADDRARTLLIESMVICRDHDNPVIGPACLATFGGVAAAQGQPQLGLQFISAGTAALEAIAKRMPDSVQAEFDRDLAAARAQLDETTFAVAWAEGQSMTREQAIELALSM